MGYILKNTSGLINTKLTDAGRRKLSQGNFNISYFQIGDSEVSYNTLESFYNQANTHILEPEFNDHNIAGIPESNKEYVKYPYFVDGNQGNTYGIPFMDSMINSIYNRATMRGFFYGNMSASPINWSALTNNQYVINANYVVDMSTLTGGNRINIIYNSCNPDITRLPQAGDFITIFYDGKGSTNCSCINLPEPGVTPTPSPTPNVSPTPQPSLPACNVTPTPTPSASVCPEPTPSAQCPPPDPIFCEMEMFSCYHMLTYRIVQFCGTEIILDRPTPDFTIFNSTCIARAIVYPPKMTEIYDSYTPQRHWNDDVINFESICGLDQFDVKIWNMNIPWSENPAGLIPTIYEGYSYFGSAAYMGSKEYFGYMSSSGQNDSSSVFYYNSFGDKITVTPSEQKAIAIIHYTNQTIDMFYGEKFAMEPIAPGEEDDVIGKARNFKLHIPWLMWHKASGCCDGQTFYVDPEGFEGFNLFEPHYLTSTKNEDMNNPGMRYYHLWDNNPNEDGYPSRVGKVFPDHKIVIIDDEEIIAAMSYKSNRNWTLPAPRLSLVTPNTCGTDNQSQVGILTGDTQYLYVTYRFTNDNGFTNSLHSNYYVKIQGPNICGPSVSQNVGVRFGAEFNCLNCVPCESSCAITQGFFAQNIEIICQLVVGDSRPEPDEWKVIDVTSQLSATSINGCITQSGLTGTTFVITSDEYENADYYDLNNYIPMVPLNPTGETLNFGDEYYFYGNLESDIQATIYEMRYKINLSFNEFQVSSNPSWNGGTSYITDIGLYDTDKNLMMVSKMQSPIVRQGIQQFLIKFDF